MKRLDHLAFRTFSRQDTANFFIEAFGYKVQAEFEIEFDKDDKALCLALEPPEKVSKDMPFIVMPEKYQDLPGTYFLAPEIFVSEGTEGSIVHNWCKEHGTGLHHIAWQVDSVKDTMELWKQRGWAEFTSEQPFHCDGLTQVFTKALALTGVVHEFIEREQYGFCSANVKKLMESTVKADRNMK